MQGAEGSCSGVAAALHCEASTTRGEDSMLKHNLEPDLKAARQHIARLALEGTTAAFQVFADSDRSRRRLARGLAGTLDSVVSELRQAQRDGCGVFVAVNETDGKGRKEGNITSCRAMFLDLDGTPLPATWPVNPDLINQTSSRDGVDKFQCWWFIEPTTDFARWRTFQELLADQFGGDPKCTLLTQVGRLSGFWHQKDRDQPFQVRIVYEGFEVGVRWGLDWLADKFGFDLNAVADGPATTELPILQEPPNGWDDPRDVARAVAHLEEASSWRPTSNGEVSLFSMAHALRDLGISPEKAEELIAEHLPFGYPSDWPDDHIVRKVANAYKYAKTDAGTRSVAATASSFADDIAIDDGTLPSAAQTFGFTPYASRDPKTVHARAWLYKPSYIRQFTTGTLSHGGVGKSTLLTAEALAMASGRALLGVEPIERLRVALWNGEDPMDELVRKVEAARKYYKLSAEDVDGWLFVDSGRDFPIQIATQDKTGTKVATPIVKKLIAALRDNKIDVLIIDPFVSSHAVSENDNTAIEQVSRTWNEIAEIANCAVHLAHHSVKARGRDSEGMDFRGGGAALAKLRHLRVLNPLSDKDAKSRGIPLNKAPLHFRADQGKGNLAPPSTADTWFKLDSISLENANRARDGWKAEPDFVGVVTSWTPPEPGLAPSDDLIETALIALGDQVWKKTSQSRAEWVGTPIAKVLGLSSEDEGHRKQIRSLIHSWVGQGILVERIPLESDAHGNKRPGYAAGKLPEVDDDEH
jgi:hypothetical protein